MITSEGRRAAASVYRQDVASFKAGLANARARGKDVAYWKGMLKAANSEYKAFQSGKRYTTYTGYALGLASRR